MGRQGSKPEPIEPRFWSKVDKSTGDCWIWIGGKTRDGYGQIKFNGSTRRAHRVIWELTFGAIPPNTHVLHKCDNPSCVNINHLFLGTDRDNTIDKVSKGRTNPSQEEQHWKAKLNREQVRQIRLGKTQGYTGTELAAKYGVSKYAIYDIWKGKNWKNVTQTSP